MKTIPKEDLLNKDFLEAEKEYNLTSMEMLENLDKYWLDICEDCGIILDTDDFKEFGVIHPSGECFCSDCSNS